jgi:hypothetical protein
MTVTYQGRRDPTRPEAENGKRAELLGFDMKSSKSA